MTGPDQQDSDIEVTMSEPMRRSGTAHRPELPAPAGQEAGAEPRDGHRRPGGRWRRAGDDGGSLRGLLGTGRSKVSLSSAMRARDIARPDAAELAEAERLLERRVAADRARATRSEDRAAPSRMWRRSPRPAPPGAARGTDRSEPTAGQPRPAGPQTAGGAGAPDGTGGSSPVRS
jgi:hypothetical protein